MTAATAVLGLAAAAPASAQSVTGTLNLTGTVAGVCSITASNGTVTGPNFSKTVTFANGGGSMVDVTGQLDASLFTNATSATGTNPVNVQAEVVCNVGTPNVTLTVTPLSMGTLGSAPLSGVVDFTGAAVITTTGGSQTFPVGGLSSSTAAPTGQASTGQQALSSPLALTNPNLVIYAYNFGTRGGPYLLPGTYNGQVQVTISPN
jgi:hypothetical protein